MKMTKRLATFAACAVMAASSMVGMGTNAATDDHGNSMSTATTFTNSVTGKIETSGDVDFFKYTATTSGIKYFCTTGNDSIITVYNSSGTSIGSSMNTYGGKKMAGANLTSGNTYYISVRENGSTYGTSYTLKVENALKVTHLYQRDSLWDNEIMKGNENAKETIGDSGCAITSCAVVINYLKNKSITPHTLNDSTYLDTNNKAKWDNIASAYYLKYDSVSPTSGVTYLKRGFPIIVYNGQHFSVAVGYENGNFLVSDVGKSSSSLQTWSENNIVSCRILYS